MNDAYPPGHPRYASRVQIGQDDGANSDAGQRDTTTEENATEEEPRLPDCNG